MAAPGQTFTRRGFLVALGLLGAALAGLRPRRPRGPDLWIGHC